VYDAAPDLPLQEGSIDQLVNDRLRDAVLFPFGEVLLRFIVHRGVPGVWQFRPMQFGPQPPHEPLRVSGRQSFPRLQLKLLLSFLCRSTQITMMPPVDELESVQAIEEILRSRI